MLYISTQVRRKGPQTTRQMECSSTLQQLAQPKPGISPTLSWTNADSLTLEQICKDLGISETELDPCMLHPPTQFQADVLQTPESRPRKGVACLKTTRIKSTKKVVKPILGRLNAPRLPNKRYQSCSRPRWRKEEKASVQVRRRPRQRSPRRGRAHPTRPRRIRRWAVLATLPILWSGHIELRYFYSWSFKVKLKPWNKSPQESFS